MVEPAAHAYVGIAPDYDLTFKVRLAGISVSRVLVGAGFKPARPTANASSEGQ